MREFSSCHAGAVLETIRSCFKPTASHTKRKLLESRFACGGRPDVSHYFTPSLYDHERNEVSNVLH